MASLQIPSLAPLMILIAAVLVDLLAITVRRNHVVVAGITIFGFAAAFAGLPWFSWSSLNMSLSMITVDKFAVFFWGLFLAAALIITLSSFAYLKRHHGHREEFYILLLLATLGAMTLVAATHLAIFFLGLETLSVALYSLIAYTHLRRPSLEAGIKYLMLAGASTAFMLFGMALLYLQTGWLDLACIAEVLGNGKLITAPLLVWAGLALFVVGLGFKLAVVPFHIWTPDVYQGAPAPATAFIATISKGAMAAFLLRFFSSAGLTIGDPLWTVLAAMAIGSMFLGNLLALRQDNLKRILAYSSIAHMGYVLVAFLAGGPAARQAVAFYLVTYFAATLMAFGLIAALSTRKYEAEGINDFRGLFWRRPLLGALMAGALLSLAGIPLTAGFIGKYYVVATGVQTSLWVLVGVLAINSVIGLYYYLRVIAAMCRPVEAEPESVAAPVWSLSGGIALAALALAILWLGIWPEPLLQIIRAAGLS